MKDDCVRTQARRPALDLVMTPFLCSLRPVPIFIHWRLVNFCILCISAPRVLSIVDSRLISPGEPRVAVVGPVRWRWEMPSSDCSAGPQTKYLDPLNRPRPSVVDLHEYPGSMCTAIRKVSRRTKGSKKVPRVTPASKMYTSVIMFDGVKLCADMFLPFSASKRGEKVPIICSMSPYGKDMRAALYGLTRMPMYAKCTPACFSGTLYIFLL